MQRREKEIESKRHKTMAEKIEVRNLHIYNQKICLLKNVNLDIEEKKITVLIGASGCGKSTFL